MGQGHPLGGIHIPKIFWASPWGKGLALMQEAPLQISACWCTQMEHRNIWSQELSLDLSDEVLGLRNVLLIQGKADPSLPLPPQLGNDHINIPGLFLRYPLKQEKLQLFISLWLQKFLLTKWPIIFIMSEQILAPRV